MVENAAQDSLSPAFARMAQARAFAAAMGDDMETSAVGFADPFTDGIGESATEGVDGSDEILASGY